jgi:tRNA modification GTPase
MDTIYALSTAPGRAGVAIIRVSGTGARLALEKIAGVFDPPPRKAILAALRYPNTGSAPSRLRGGGEASVPQSGRAQNNQEIDHGLVIFFEGPASFTGEDVAEFHLHGGGAVVRAIASALASIGCRMAEAGEFTRRAFEGGKLDLAEVEGLADLIHAETEAQRRQALAQLDGALSDRIEEWRSDIIKIMAYSETEIDFPDEDLPENVADARLTQLQELRAEIVAELAQKKRGEILRIGFRVAILGAPNAGKSSLLNLLARRPAAIVSPQPGTTRDIIEVQMDVEGYPVILTDTAGLREAENPVESEGIARAHAAAQNADLKLVLFDATAAPDQASLSLCDENTIVVLNKTDLLSDTSSQHKLGSISPPLARLRQGFGGFESIRPPKLEERRRKGGGRDGVQNAPRFALSAKTGAGLQELINAISTKLRSLTETNSSAPLLTRQRHAEALAETLNYLDRALAALAKKSPSELTAEELRLASRSLARITGEVDVEDLLDVIFRDFCVGK